MNFADIKRLADLMPRYNLTSLSYEDAEFKLSLSKTLSDRSGSGTSQEIIAEAFEASGARADSVVVTAPVVGTAYRAREPGKAPLVSVGDTVAKGDALCVIEAMKVFSEITAPCAGNVVEIAFADGSLAEFGAKLIVIEPSESQDD